MICSLNSFVIICKVSFNFKKHKPELLMMTSYLLFLLLVTMAASGHLTPPEHTVQDVDPSDPEVQACASFALENFNYFSKDPHIYAITKFYSVKKADIGGGQYDMDVEVRRTQSTKVPMSGDLTPEHEVFRCHFVVLSAPWKKQRVLLQSSCTPMAGSGDDMQ
ncbi:hypothetical protein GN956_G3986 [Arapaima gigas]